MKGYFFNAEPTTDLKRHPTGLDREYDADSHAEFFEPLFGAAGVMLTEGQEEPCQIYSQGGGILGIRAGTAYVKGRMVNFDGSETLQAKAGYVVARMNKSMEVRDFQFLIVDAPVQEKGDIYDLPLARITYTGQAVNVTDQRVYLSAKVLGGHRHRAEDVDGVAGHKHSAEDINSGVLDKARVPYQVDAEHLIAAYQVVSLQQEINCGPNSNATYNFTIPFPTALAARPKRIIVRIGANGSNWGVGGPNTDQPAFVVLDMAYVGSSLWGSVSGMHRKSRSGDDGLDVGTWVETPLNDNEWTSNEVFSYRGHTKGYLNWYGFGGNAFFPTRTTVPTTAPTNEAFYFNIGSFSYDNAGIHFKIREQTLPAGWSTLTGKLSFRAKIFIFD